MKVAAKPQLLGFWTCVALVVGNSIGSGIFLLPATLAPYGRNSFAAWGLTALGALLLALVFARLSRARPDSGGPYAYVHLAFGPFAAFIVAWGYWVSIWVGNAAIATGAVAYLSSLLPWIAAQPGHAAAVTLFFLWLLTLVNCYGVQASAWVQNVTTVLKLLPLLAIAAFGLFAVTRADFASAAKVPFSFHGVTGAATLTLWAMLGLESATIPAEKVSDPGRTIARATLLGTLVTALICMIACSVAILLLPPAVLAQSQVPFADLAGQWWGPRAAMLLAVFAAISGLGCLNGWVLLQAELPLAMAKDGVFPRPFARETKRGTPGFALIFGSGLVTILILMNYQQSMVKVFQFMTLLSTTACLVLYAMCALALLRLQWNGELGRARRGTSPLALVGVAAAVYSIWAIIGAGAKPALWGAALLSAGVPVYLWSARQRRV